MLAPGTRLGVYEVIAAIGAGGMGEVYRARDARLKRDVALKFLPESFASDPDRLARFQREAEVLASLNHPNIAAIYGLGESDGFRALVMELVEGETLADRIARGPIPIDEALPIATQIAEALDAAHKQGIIHRDLKPANIKVTPDGRVKVLDFGLAKLAEPSAIASIGPSPLSLSPTITSPAMMTGVGMLLGTAAYMSPEQARGKVADKRSDIWAFGCVLYEMLTGAPAYQGESVTDTIAAVLRGEPDWDAVPHDTPIAIRRLLRGCLDKDHRVRISDACVVMFLLTEHPTLTTTASLDPAAAEHKLQAAISNTRRDLTRVVRRWQFATALLMIVASALLWATWHQPADISRSLVRLDVDLGPVSLYANQGMEVVISPDGNRIVYVANNRLYTRAFDNAAGIELKGTDGGFAPFFSPDGRAIGFFAARQLKTLTFESGLITKVCDTGALPRSGSWGDDGFIVADMGLNNGALSTVASTGGVPVPLTDGGDSVFATPVVLPGSTSVLFSTLTTQGAEIRVLSKNTKLVKTLYEGVSPRFVPTATTRGFLLFVQGTNLLAARLRLDTLELEGAPVPMLDQIAPGPSGVAQFDVAHTGRAVFQSGTENTRTVVIQWLTPEGFAPLVRTPGTYTRVAVSPDGRRIAYQADNQISLYDPATDATTRLTFDGGGLPRWSPDGRYIAFSRADGLYLVRSDGAGTAHRLTTGQSQNPMSFTPDGRQLVFQQTVTGKNDLWIVPVSDSPTSGQLESPSILIHGPSDERQAAVSPDGKWLAYASDETGEFQIYVRPFPNVDGGKWQVSSDSGLYPTWSRTEKRLFFRNNDNQLVFSTYAVSGGTLTSGRTQLWSQERLADFGVAGSQNFDLAPDGRRIAAIVPASGEDRRHQIVFLDNFLDELKRRVPTGNK